MVKARGAAERSDRAQVPVEIALGRLGVEPVSLDLLQSREAIDELISEIFPQNGRAIEAGDRGIPIRGKALCLLLIAVSGHGRAWIELAGDAVMNAGKHGGKHEIGIGIGACGAVLDVASFRIPGRNAQ